MDKSKFLVAFLPIILLIILSASLISVVSVFDGVTYAESVDFNLDKLNEEYTDSDYMYKLNDKIQNYPNYYHHKYANEFNFTQDDPITNIVPRYYFEHIGDYIYIGKEYGFFVKTQKVDFNGIDYSSDIYPPRTSQNNISDVLVFDIITQTNLDETIDNIIVTVNPIFQYQFAYVNGNEQYIISYIDNTPTVSQYNINGLDSCIIPIPIYRYGKGYQFEQLNKYYVKDICFGANLQNEQHLNTFNEKYDAYNDLGSFITSYDYTYRGVYHDLNGLDISRETGFLANSILGMSFGVISTLTIGPISKVFGILSLASSAISVAESFITLRDKVNGELSDKVVNSGSASLVNYYNTKDGQLAHYVDNNGNPALTKSAMAIVNGNDNDGNVWYGIGDYAKCYFSISNFSDNVADWQTRYIQEIGLTIVDNLGISYGTQLGKSTHIINNPIYDTLKIGEKKELIVLPQGANYFNFTSLYTGYLNFEFEKDYGYEIFVNGQKIANTGDTYEIYAGKDCTYQIEIHSDIGDVIGFRLMPLWANKDYDLENDNEIYAYYCTKTGIYDIAYDFRSILSDLIEIDDDGRMNSQSINYSQVLFEGTLYLIVLKNEEGIKGNVGCNVDSSTNQSISIDKKYGLPLRSQKDFYEFDCQFDGNYTVQLEDVSGNVTPAFSLVDEFGNTYLPNEYVENGAKFYGLKEGTKYFVGIQSGECKMSLVYDTTNYVWKQKVNGVWQELPSFEVEQMRGTEQEYSLWIGGVMQTEYHIHAASSQGIWEDSNKVKLPDNFVYGDHISLYAYKNKNINLYYPVALDIKGVVDPAEFAFKVEYVNKLQASWTWPTGVYSAKLYVKKGDDVLASKTFNVNTAKSWDLMHDLWNVNALNAKIQFEYSNGKDTTTCDESVDLHLYYDKEKLRYYIYNALQLSYLRYDQSHSFYYLKNDINLLYPWTPIPLFKTGSYFNGDLHTIYGLTLNVDDSLPAWGFFATAEGMYGRVNFVNAKITCSATSSNWIAVGVVAGVNRGIFMGGKLSTTDPACTLNVQKTNSCFGGFVGYNEGNIYGAHLIGYEMTGSGEMGGIVGYSKYNNKENSIEISTVENSTINYKYIAEARRIGGIVGYELKGSIRESQILSCHMNIINTSEIYDTVAMGYLIGAADNVTFIANSGSGSSFNINAVHTNYRKYLFNGEWQYYGRMDNCRFPDPNDVLIEPDEPEIISDGVPVETDEPETI